MTWEGTRHVCGAAHALFLELNGDCMSIYFIIVKLQVFLHFSMCMLYVSLK